MDPIPQAEEGRCFPRLDEFKVLLIKLVCSSTLFYMILFLTAPIAVQLAYQIICDNIEEDDGMCDSSEVSSLTSRTLLYVGLANNVPAFLVSGFYASVADRYGRKVAMHLPTFGYSVYVAMLLLMSITRTTGGRITVTQCLIYNFIGLGSLGMSGSFATYQMALFSYAADITKTRGDLRGTVYSLLEASLFFSKTVGPLVAGLFAQAEGFNGPLLLSMSMCVLCFLFNLLVLPESVKGRFPDYGSPLIFDPLKTFRNVGLLFEKWSSVLPWTSLAFFLFFVSYMGNNEIIILFVKHKFGWGPALIGYYEASDALTQAFGMILLPWAIKRVIPYVDTHWLLVGYIARTVHYLLFAYAGSTAMLFMLVPIIALASTITPRSRAIVSNSVLPEEQAAVMSGFSAVQSAATFCVPGISLGFSYTVYTLPELMYLVFSGLCCVSAIMMAYVVFGIASQEPEGLSEKFLGTALKRKDTNDSGSVEASSRVLSPLAGEDGAII